MSDTWTIKGQAGKAVNATARTLPQLNAEGVAVAFRSLAMSKLTWDVWLRDLTEAATLVPEYGQTISLYLNGDRYFHGYVTGREPLFSADRWGYSITVSDAWYFLANTSISTEMPDETTVVQKRAVYLFDTGSVTDHLISLVSRAIEVGLPISLGSIATCFDVPRLSLREMSYGEAISELMRIMADGMVYLDHSGVDGTHPALCMQRRSNATVVTLNPTELCIPSLRCKPRYDLKVTELTVNYAERQTYQDFRGTAFKAQTAGTWGGTMPDRQLITVSGPEVNLTLPQDLTDSVVVQSAPFAGHIADALKLWHDLLKAGAADNIEAYGEYAFDAENGGVQVYPLNPTLMATDSEGNDLDLADWPYFLTKGEIKDWWKKDGLESIQARITATIAEITDVPFGDDPVPAPKWAEIIGGTRLVHLVTVGGVAKFRNVWQATVSTVIPLVQTLWDEDTTLIRQEDWGWFNPPEDLAENLLATQNWLPWEGEIPIATDDSPANNLVGSVLNISNWVPECAAMKAMISGYTVRPATGQIAYTLGPPARHSFRDLVNRFRQSGADNIYWLSSNAATPVIPPPGGIPSGALGTESGDYIRNEDGTTYPTTEDS
jgi:hypothetical protein